MSIKPPPLPRIPPPKPPSGSRLAKPAKKSSRPPKQTSAPSVTFTKEEVPTRPGADNPAAIIYQTVWQLYDALTPMSRLELMEIGSYIKVLEHFPEDRKMLVALAEFLVARRAPRVKDRELRGNKK